jgi:alpha-amylase/alpha-mannosidase (GH57 family)
MAKEDISMTEEKYIAIHAHFYQPPRENPWTGEIDIQDSAAPYDNWNHRIMMECYLPNLYARIKNYKNELLEIVNNYEYLNFNFGPTLLNWIEKTYPVYYQDLVNTIKSQKEKYNAIAQTYNHTILPLDTFEDKVTQIYWGIKDFEHRFGFYPKGIWLSEAAVNEDVLKILIDHKIEYIILAPYQIKKIQELKTGKEIKSINDSSPCIWYDRDIKGNKIKTRSIFIFPYNGELSKKIAFDNITIDSKTFVENIKYRLNEKCKFILIANDGETYGHHHKFADMTLAHTFKYELERNNIQIITLHDYLKKFEVLYEAEIDEGIDKEGTSWSCSHGVRRWKGGCPCGDEGKYDTSWRFSFRNAMNWLKEVANDVYREEGGKIFNDIWKARNEYIDVILDREGKINDFIKNNFKAEINQENIQKAIKLLEMQKYSMFMFTSCGWFFNDISRIETQQNMKYALKAIEIIESFGFKGINKIFASILEMANSNFKELGNGKKIFENYILPCKIDSQMSAAYLALKTHHYGKKKHSNSIYEIEIKDSSFKEERLNINFLFKDYEKQENKEYSININFTDNDLPEIEIKETEKKEYGKIEITSFPQHMQSEIIIWAVCKLKKDNVNKIENIFNIYSRIIEKNPYLMFQGFSEIKEELVFFINQILEIKLRELFLTAKKENIDEIEKIIKKAEEINLEIKYKAKLPTISTLPIFAENLKNNVFTESEIKRLENILFKLNFYEANFHIENIEHKISK